MYVVVSSIRLYIFDMHSGEIKWLIALILLYKRELYV
jgi:hypothetical protein